MVNNTLTIFQAYFSTLCSEFLSFFSHFRQLCVLVFTVIMWTNPRNVFKEKALKGQPSGWKTNDQ